MSYKIVSQSDERARNSATGRKQKAIARAVMAGGGQLTVAAIAANALELLADDEASVSASEVSGYLAALKAQFPAAYGKLPKVKRGKKGKTAMVAASAEDMDDFLSSLDDEESDTESA